MAKRLDYLISSANDRNYPKNRTIHYTLHKHLEPVIHDGDHTMGCFLLIAESTDRKVIDTALQKDTAGRFLKSVPFGGLYFD